MKTLENILHLYLGCDVKHDNGDILKLHGIVGREVHLVDSDYYDISSIDHITPILRPLDSMTEEEADFICDTYYFGSIDFDVDKKVFSSNIAKRLSHQMPVAVYLLSKSFDLFGLIDSGLAIDATKLEGYGK